MARACPHAVGPGAAIGFIGLAFLVSPGLHNSRHGDSRQMIATVVILTGSFVWTAGSVIARRTTINISGFASAGWQMLLGGLFTTIVMFTTGGYHGAHWGLLAWASILYLVTFGSLVGYTAYIYLLNNVAVAKVTTYAYINPIVAVILGAIFLRERFVLGGVRGHGLDPACSLPGDQLEAEDRRRAQRR